MISIIIPVYREQDTIRLTLSCLSDLFSSIRHEILVVDGESGASTLAALNSGPLLGRNVRLLAAGRGRGVQMNAGAKAAKGDLFFFVHADSCPDPAGVRKMVTAWQDSLPQFFCGAFDLAIDSPRPIFRIIEKISSLRSRFTGIPYGDQGIFISKQLFVQLGGFPDAPLMEDVGLMAAVKRAKVAPTFIDEKMLTSARRWNEKGIACTTLKNWLLITLYALGVSPKKLAEWY